MDLSDALAERQSIMRGGTSLPTAEDGRTSTRSRAKGSVRRHLFTWIHGSARRLARRLGDDERRSARLVWGLVWCHWRMAALAFLANLFAAFFEGSTMTILTVALQTLAGEESANLTATLGRVGAIIDSMWGSLEREMLFLLLIGLAVMSQLLRSGLQFGGRVAAAHLNVNLMSDVRDRLFRQSMSMSYAQVSRYKLGDLVSYFEQATFVGKLISLLNGLLSQVLVIVAYIIVLLWLSWPMTLAALVVLILISSTLRYIVVRIRQIAHTFMQASVALSERTIEFLQGIRLVRTFAREDFAIERVTTVLFDSMVAKRQGLTWGATITPLVESLTVVGVAIFIAGGYLLMDDLGPSVLPRLFTFLFVLYRLMPRVGSLNDAWARVNDTMPTVNRIAAFLRTDNKEYTRDGGQAFSGLREGIEFRSVSMRYIEGERRAVENISFTIPRGSMVALVGESGAGKSTVADLALRLYDPTDGQILVDGVPLYELSLKAWRSRIAVVGQEAFVFNASIRDNIAFGKLDADEEEIVAAAQAANAHDFIMELADGYDTIVGDRGYRLSGGQRQRLAIARAILRDPEVLILDEATSDLDSHSERMIQQALDKLRVERTVLAIAHRLSTVMMANQILVLERGRLIEQGTHQELLALNGRYAHFWRLQSEL